MKSPVLIKGNQAGLTVCLDPELPFDELLALIEKKFRETARFWGTAQMALTIEGRELSESEELKVVEAITGNSGVDILCLIDRNGERTRRCERALDEKRTELMTHTGQFFKRTLKEGEVLRSESSLVLIGDVEAGARVIARGNIVILGELHGTAQAGCDGNLNTAVVALLMAPTLVKVGDLFLEQTKKGRAFGRGPMTVYAEGGRIFCEPFKKSFFPGFL